jgi:hypothetical protein
MSSITIGFIVLACVFVSAMLGMFLGSFLPRHHLDGDSRDTMKLATGLIATLSALVLGLLVSSAKGTFDKTSNELNEAAVRTVELDRMLAQYGPETKEIRDQVKGRFSTVTDVIASGDESRQAKLDTPETVAIFEGIQARIRALSPTNDTQREIKPHALQMFSEVSSGRWLLIVEGKGSISTPLLVILVLWLSTIFAAWGVFAPRNRVVIAALFACALSASGATFLILEMDRPLTGLIRVDTVSMRQAEAHLGQ